ncbi:pentapeptide repeat-containing protein [Amycolatopsis sp. NPDC004079]|uniref:pentapeptide repeat-containing protein n=1 Tax=Amycolatopsis sp. NPDC004079 TaxID=3154549 RepID=UPI0033AE00A7
MLVLVAQPPGQALVGAGIIVLLVIALAIRIATTDDEQARADARLHASQYFQGACKNVGNDDNEVVRAGGFYALGMIWRDWPDEHQRVLDYVQAWLQKHAVGDDSDSSGRGNAGRPDMDVAAALGELLNRPTRPERRPIDLARCSFVGFDLRAANLPGAVLTKIDLTRARLADAVLNGVDLDDAALVEADLSRANLAGAMLRNARLERANLTGADLSGANLQRAGLVAAKLAGVNFAGANLLGARLEHADLRETTGLTAAQLKTAELDPNTRLPADIDRDEVTGPRVRRQSF